MAEQNKPLNIVVLEGDGIGKEVVGPGGEDIKSGCQAQGLGFVLKICAYRRRGD